MLNTLTSIAPGNPEVMEWIEDEEVVQHDYCSICYAPFVEEASSSGEEAMEDVTEEPPVSVSASSSAGVPPEQPAVNPLLRPVKLKTCPGGNHYYHLLCLGRALRIRHLCPVCRSPVHF